MVNRLKKSYNNVKAFTLIELMIVVSIIGIISAIAIPNYISYRAKGQDVTAKSEARNYYTSAIAQVADTGVLFDSTIGTGEPTGFATNDKVDRVGLLTVSSTGVVISTMSFSHINSSTLYTLAADGKIS